MACIQCTSPCASSKQLGFFASWPTKLNQQKVKTPLLHVDGGYSISPTPSTKVITTHSKPQSILLLKEKPLVRRHLKTPCGLEIITSTHNKMISTTFISYTSIISIQNDKKDKPLFIDRVIQYKAPRAIFQAIE